MKDNYQLVNNILKEAQIKPIVKKIGTGVLWGTGLTVAGMGNQMGVDAYNKVKKKIKEKEKKRKLQKKKKPTSN